MQDTFPFSKTQFMPDTDWIIRLATSRDIDSLIDFNCAIARETEGKELNREIVTRGVTRGLMQGDEVVYFVAECQRHVIGCLMLTREWSDWRDGWLAWIQSVYVSPEHRGKGVFRELQAHATASAKENPDVVGMRLYVEAENHDAQAVYQRTGFTDPNYKVLEKIF